MAPPEAPTKKRAAPTRGPSGVQLGEATARSMILQGGALVFAQRGVRLSSVEDILQAAKVSRRTFYRFYQNKEDVLEALYRTGTEGLLAACRLAVQEEREPLRQLERCIEVHLRNARGLGRLMFVLGGEAQRHESPLHARRMQVHDELVALLAGAHAARQVDPWLFRALFLALEGITRVALEQGNEGREVTEDGLARARRVMMRMAAASIAGEGQGVPPLPSHIEPA